MSYAELDPAIEAWLRRHRLTLYTKYQDSEVRSVDVVDAKGKKFQIWIDPPTSGKIGVHAWDYRKRRRDWSGATGNIDEYLEAALASVTSWMKG